jgi:tRNA G18 (ribose-2'-O)-methylase SpoU
MRKLKNEELGRLTVDEFKNAEKVPVILVLDNIRSLNNIGSVFRTADAFRLEKIYLCGITATPPHRDIHKTALGATESVEWEYIDNTVKAIKILKDINSQIFAIEQADNSISLDEVMPDFNKKIVLIFGNEIKGVQEDVFPLIDDCIEIPQFGIKHSLNIAVSVGIVVWEIYCKQKIFYD